MSGDSLEDLKSKLAEAANEDQALWAIRQQAESEFIKADYAWQKAANKRSEIRHQIADLEKARAA